MIKKVILAPLLAVGMFLAMAVAATPASASTGGDLSGRWVPANQVDSESQSLVFAGSGFSLLLVYADQDETEFCDGGEVLMAGRGSFLRDTVAGLVNGVCENGIRVRGVEIELHYDSARDVLVDSEGTTWVNIFR